MEVNDVHIEPNIHMESASDLNLDTEDQVTQKPLPVLLVNVKATVKWFGLI
jgi:hypothetical protein